jgi:hypothetical protein
MYLTAGEMDTRMPLMHVQLLQEGRTSKGTASVLRQFLVAQPDGENFPGQIWVSPQLIKDIKECRYRGFDISADQAGRGIDPFSTPSMSLKQATN